MKIAIDPGESIGIAIRDNDKGLKTFTITDPEALWDLLSSTDMLFWEIVLLENFSTAGRMSSHGLYTVRLVGGIQAICYVFKHKLVFRAPQARARAQRRANSILKGTLHTIHEEDALAHLLSWEMGNNERSKTGQLSDKS